MIPGFAVELSYGIIYANQCPIQPLINIFLIVHGCSLMTNAILLLTGFLAARYIKRSLSPSPCFQRLAVGSIIGQLIILFFDIVWLIVGQVWIFGAQRAGVQTSNSTLTTTYCHSNLFWSGFVLIIINYAVLLIIILVVVVRFIIKRRKIKQGKAAIKNELI
jgi:hypothetical protein